MTEKRRRPEGRAGRVLRHPLVALIVAPLLVLAIWYFVSKWLEGPEDGGPPDVRIDLPASLVNPRTDTAAAEYVCLVNEGDGAVSLTGWKLTDAEGVVDVLPQFTLPAHAKVRVHPGGGDERTDTRHDLYGEAGTSWNNEGDTVTLLEPDGTVVDSTSYGSRADGEVRGTCGPGQRQAGGRSPPS
ncbi:MAG TPA: lamin tail domain-containing protein [Solirubrobacterales bacterium]